MKKGIPIEHKIGVIFIAIAIIALIFGFQQAYPYFFLTWALSFSAFLCLAIGWAAFRDARIKLYAFNVELSVVKAEIKFQIEMLSVVTLCLVVLGLILSQTVHNSLIKESLKGIFPVLLLLVQGSSTGRKIAIAKAELNQIKK